MSIHHDGPVPNDGAPWVFASLGGFTCSVCAPGKMTAHDVEDFASARLGRPVGGWVAVDKAKAGLGEPTPNPCNIAQGRQHWFLLAGVQAAQLGFMGRK